MSARRITPQRRLVQLRREWKAWRSGRALQEAGWWGLPWCAHNRRPVPSCEGCATRAHCREQAAEIEALAAELQAPSGPAEGELLALVNGKWVAA